MVCVQGREGALPAEMPLAEVGREGVAAHRLVPPLTDRDVEAFDAAAMARPSR